MTRWQRWSERRQAAGKCSRCDQPKVTAAHCLRHALLDRLRHRVRNNGQPWRIGGPGRPPQFTEAP